MWRAVVAGSSALERNANCTYDIRTKIPHTHCKFKVATFRRLFGAQLGIMEDTTTVKGECVNGTCLCDEGYSGRSDWINLDTYSCQVNLAEIRGTAGILLVLLSFLVFASVRLIHKTYTRSKKGDRNFKAQLQKPQIKFVCCALLGNLPFFIFCCVKYAYPTTLLVDPKHNPVFFVIYFLSLNLDWWAITILFRSVTKPFVRGIHNSKDRDAILRVEKQLELSKKVPLIDLVTRIVHFIVPAVVTAQIDNRSGATITIYYVYKSYSYLKLIVFGNLYCRSILIVLKMSEHSSTNITNKSKSASSFNSTGSTAEVKLQDFRWRLRHALYTVLFLINICVPSALVVVMLADNNEWYSLVAIDTMIQRGLIIFFVFWSIEILYLDMFPYVLKKCMAILQLIRGEKKEGRLPSPSVEQEQNTHDNDTFAVPNPMLSESRKKVNVGNLAL